MGETEDAEPGSLEFTPTWVVAAVCTLIVAISLAVERLLHFTGKYLKKKNQRPLFEALQKVKEELMLLGFISLLLTVFQGRLVNICVHKNVTRHLLPCALPHASHSSHTSHAPHGSHAAPETHHRHLLGEDVSHCAKNEVPLLSLEALHHLHIFIFVLAIVHVTFTVLTLVFGGAKIRQWKLWEDSIAKENPRTEEGIDDYHGKLDQSFGISSLEPNFTHVHEHHFIRKRFHGVGKTSATLGWLHSFFKQFYGSVTESDYLALRHGFIMTHCRGNPKFNFHKYMIRTLEDDFKKVVGIRWYLWIFADIFLLLNINGWHTYFWIAFIPFILLLAVGTKLEHVIAELAHDVAEKHVAIEGDLIVQPSDNHFWFHRPRLVLKLMHFILFQNAFEIAYFFWILVIFGLHSCIMGRLFFIVPRLIIGVFIQLLCSYSTLPLYALVTQMGTRFKKAIFDEHVQLGLVGWAQSVKRKKSRGALGGFGRENSRAGSPAGVQLGGMPHQEPTQET